MTRAAVHAAAGHPLGAADPRQEGPADLRLVPPALAAWAAAALATGAPGDWTAGAVLAGLALAGVLLVRAAVVPIRRGRRAGTGPSGVRRRVNGVAVAAVLLCAAAGAGSAWLHGADRHRGPVPGLAERYAHVTVDLTVTSDPRPTRPRVRGDTLSAAGLVLDAGGARRGGRGGGRRPPPPPGGAGGPRRGGGGGPAGRPAL
ncbi:MBL fold metallo-hydrolase, partial [Streptomyces niveus]